MGVLRKYKSNVPGRGVSQQQSTANGAPPGTSYPAHAAVYNQPVYSPAQPAVYPPVQSVYPPAMADPSGLSPRVRMRLEQMYGTGHVRRDEVSTCFRVWITNITLMVDCLYFCFQIDSRSMEFLAQMTEDDALRAMDEFASRDTKTIRNVSAFFMSILRKFDQPPSAVPQSAPSYPYQPQSYPPPGTQPMYGQMPPAYQQQQQPQSQGMDPYGARTTAENGAVYDPLTPSLDGSAHSGQQPPYSSYPSMGQSQPQYQVPGSSSAGAYGGGSPQGAPGYGYPAQQQSTQPSGFNASSYTYPPTSQAPSQPQQQQQPEFSAQGQPQRYSAPPQQPYSAPDQSQAWQQSQVSPHQQQPYSTFAPYQPQQPQQQLPQHAQYQPQGSYPPQLPVMPFIPPAGTEGMSLALQARIDSLFRSGAIAPSDLDDRSYNDLRALQEVDAIRVIDEFSKVDRAKIRKLGAYFYGVLRKHVQTAKEKGVYVPRPKANSDRKRDRDRSYSRDRDDYRSRRDDRRSRERGRDDHRHRDRSYDRSSRGRDRSRDRSRDRAGDRSRDRDRKEGGKSDPYGRTIPKSEGGSGGSSLTAIRKVPDKVYFTIQALVASGALEEREIDERLGGVLGEMDEADAIQVLGEYAACDFSRVRNKSAYLMGMLKRFRKGERGPARRVTGPQTSANSDTANADAEALVGLESPTKVVAPAGEENQFLGYTISTDPSPLPETGAERAQENTADEAYNPFEPQDLVSSSEQQAGVNATQQPGSLQTEAHIGANVGTLGQEEIQGLTPGLNSQAAQAANEPASQQHSTTAEVALTAESVEPGHQEIQQPSTSDMPAPDHAQAPALDTLGLAAVSPIDGESPPQ